MIRQPPQTTFVCFGSTSNATTKIYLFSVSLFYSVFLIVSWSLCGLRKCWISFSSKRTCFFSRLTLGRRIWTEWARIVAQSRVLMFGVRNLFSISIFSLSQTDRYMLETCFLNRTMNSPIQHERWKKNTHQLETETKLVKWKKSRRSWQPKRIVSPWRPSSSIRQRIYCGIRIALIAF